MRAKASAPPPDPKPAPSHVSHVSPFCHETPPSLFLGPEAASVRLERALASQNAWLLKGLHAVGLAPKVTALENFLHDKHVSREYCLEKVRGSMMQPTPLNLEDLIFPSFQGPAPS